MRWQITSPQDVVDVGMRVSNMTQQMIDRSFWSIAFTVVSPFSGRIVWRQRTTVSQTAAKRFVTISVRSLGIVRVVMSVGQMQYFEGGSTVFWQWIITDFWFRNWRK